MLSNKDVSVVYETLLSSPGMSDDVKINLRISRKTILLLTKIIELGRGARNENMQDGLLQGISNETLDEIKSISGILLEKAGLTDMYEKINSFNAK